MENFRAEFTKIRLLRSNFKAVHSKFLLRNPPCNELQTHRYYPKATDTWSTSRSLDLKPSFLGLYPHLALFWEHTSRTSFTMGSHDWRRLRISDLAMQMTSQFRYPRTQQKLPTKILIRNNISEDWIKIHGVSYAMQKTSLFKKKISTK